MNIALIGDPHFANHKVFGKPTMTPGVNTRLANVTRAMTWISNDMRKRNISRTFILGDTTHHHGVLTPAIAGQIETSFMNLLLHSDDLTVMSGNHDMDISGASIVPFLGGQAGVLSLKPVTLVEGMWVQVWHKNFVICCASYGVEAADINIQMAHYPDATKIVLMHHSFDGAVHGAHEFQPPGGIKPSDMDETLNIYSGHYHKRQKINRKIQYIGAPLQNDFGEAGYEPGYTILHLADDGAIEEEFIPMPRTVAPRFVILPHDVTDAPGDPATDYYRIDLPYDVDPREIQKLKDQLTHVVVKPIPSDIHVRSRVEEFLGDEEKQVDLSDTIDVYAHMNMEDEERANELADLGRQFLAESEEAE